MAIGLIAVPQVALAAKFQIGDSGGGSSTPIGGSSVEVSFNPSVVLTVQPTETIEVLLLRIAQAINDASSGLYTATVSEATTVEILRTNGDEIDDLRFIENDGGIQSVLISVDRPQLIAQIGAVVEAPSTGMIILTLNDRVVSVSTMGLQSGDDVTQALLAAIRRAGFQADLNSTFLVVRRDLVNGTGLMRLGLRSTDPSIITSDLALLPDPTIARLSRQTSHLSAR